jgi:hypothetical protein
LQTAVGLLFRTKTFVFLRFITIVITTVPIWVGSYQAGLAIGGYLGIHHPLFLFSYMFVCYMAGYILMNWFRKFVLFYIKAAHIAVLTILLTGKKEISLQAIDGFGMVFSKLFSTSVFFGADMLTKYGLEEISKFIFDKDIIPNIGKLNFLVRWLGKVIKTTLSYSDEVVLSYIFYCEMDESNNKKLMENILDGIILYVKSSISLLKAAFTALLGRQIFTWICEIIVILGTIWSLRLPLIYLIPIYFGLKYVFSILGFTLTEPYETLNILAAFYAKFEPIEEVEMDIISKLSSISGKFSSLASKILKKKIDTVEDPDNIIDVESIVTDHIDSMTKDILK